MSVAIAGSAAVRRRAGAGRVDASSAVATASVATASVEAAAIEIATIEACPPAVISFQRDSRYRTTA
jgi:hypothetical protein